MFDLLEWLQERDIAYTWVNKDNVSFDCPWCGKGKKHFQVCVTEQIAHCFHCDKGTNWIGLIAKIAKIPYEEAKGLVEFSVAITKAPSPVAVSSVKLPPKARWTLDAKEYLESRRISEDEIERYRIYLSITSHRIILPVYVSGIAISYQERALYPWQTPKYLTGKGSHLGRCLWGIDDCVPDSAVVICEGIFDAISMRKAQCQAVASFGKQITNNQIELLSSRGFSKIFLAYDNDAFDHIKQAYYKLSKHFSKISIVPIEKKDPGEMLPDECRKALDSAVTGWREFSHLHFGKALG